MSNYMNESNPLGGDVWRRGARLGLQWLALFAVVAGLLYAGMGFLGWSGTMRALVALLVSPLVGSIIIAIWWMARRPALMPPDDQPGE